MPEAAVYNFQGEVVKKISLDDSVFNVLAKPEIVREAVVAQMANSRIVLAHTKDRSEVRGGGKKPWKQKGTGRARHGSIRSPLWIGGGIAFGPTKDRNFEKKINKKVRKAALKMVLSEKARENKIYLIEDPLLKEEKTKSSYTLLKNLKLRRSKDSENKTKKAKEQKVLVVLTKEKKDLWRYFKNLEKVTVISAESLNVVDLLKNQSVVAPVSCIDSIVKTYNK